MDGIAVRIKEIANEILNQLNDSRVGIMCMDDFYKNLCPEEMQKVLERRMNFDEPNSFDFDLLRDALTKIKKGGTVEIPEYDFKSCIRTFNGKTIGNVNVLIFEGILSLYSDEIAELLDLKVFVTADDDIRLIRRIQRDTKERGRSIDSQAKADAIISNDGTANNLENAIRLIVSRIREEICGRNNINEIAIFE
ncbi:hypothetical protein PRIPAC_95710 [Pristionchus pacificus]|uniref:PRK domain-containing protein n=1 Tax=Pristionchus pacificus TaxID=54126 RepID=A0A2A6CV88_PRIPA|nr:hypothetical protein PRIPAC_95710 [Pristionchus pacificus]|eukprot:PDM81941.1 hypothetical protein PRIPAC_34095 [Pristionchus pacificus]